MPLRKGEAVQPQSEADDKDSHEHQDETTMARVEVNHW
jgi:hypothetical protein